jgi:hypothetical protein
MIRQVLIAAILAAAVASPAAYAAEPQTLASQTLGPKNDVAGAFIAAAKAQDRQAALSLLAADVAIDFPTGANLGRQGHGEGQAFVIGYLDGLFDADSSLSVDSSAPQGDAVRFLAHKTRSNDRYAIEVEVQDHQVVKVTVNLEDRAALAALAPQS